MYQNWSHYGNLVILERPQSIPLPLVNHDNILLWVVIFDSHKRFWQPTAAVVRDSYRSIDNTLGHNWDLQPQVG